MVSVYCELGTESLNVVQMYFMPQSALKGPYKLSVSVEWCMVAFYGAHNGRRYENPLPLYTRAL
jgi:hypothetical protein